MPTYDYHCDKCECRFSAMHKISDAAPPCPSCGGSVSKLLSAPAVHGGGNRSSAQPSTSSSTHGCGVGACGCRH